jgi:nucleoside-diphosphate-sugar epimerase
VPDNAHIRPDSSAGIAQVTPSDSGRVVLPYSFRMNPDVLLVGCGDLGADIGLRLAGLGHRVVAIRRNADRVPPPLIGVSADLTREAPNLPDLDLVHLVIALSASSRTEDAYRAIYVGGLRRALDCLDDMGQHPSRAVLVSSTGVFGTNDPSIICTEDTTAEPSGGTAKVLLEAEQLFASRVPHGTILRLAGLYGRGPARFVDKVARGEVTDPNRWTNRIHREDAAAAVIHLLTRPQPPGPLYLGVDDEPALLGDVAAYIARRLALPSPPAADPEQAHGKRLSNALLRASGWLPTYRAFREGYADYPKDERVLRYEGLPTS